MAEARCWVLRNRANPGYGIGLVFLGHLLHRWWIFADRRGVVVWLGPALTKLLVMASVSGVFSLVGCCPRVVVVQGWCSCPYFENCIVDASIFVVFCCVTSY